MNTDFHFSSPVTAPFILLALTHDCGPGSVLSVGRSGLSARFRGGSANEPPLSEVKGSRAFRS